jgi:hypothetical protein
VPEEGWAKHKVVYHRQPAYSSSAIAVVSLLAFTFLPAIIGWVNIKRIKD